ncbi:MAG: hypothetical protein J6W62_01940 [Spirochaetia bacterium]|nr:hypothetical protein [Spirochaetia bacterium]
MKKSLILVLILSLLLALTGCSGGGGGDDDLPPYSDAPYSARLAAAITCQAILDIAYDIEINGLIIPNVDYQEISEDNVILTFSNAQRDNVVFDYSTYTVNITGTIKVNDNNSVYDISVARCVGTLEVYYCSFYMVYKNNKVDEVILDGKEYDPKELN